MQKYVLDTNCFIDASRSEADAVALEAFCENAGPGLYLSSVVVAELTMGLRPHEQRDLEDKVFRPYVRRSRVVTPSAAAWKMLGIALSKLSHRDGLVLKSVPRSFIFDILIAYSCKEMGAMMISKNTSDLTRIHTVFAFEFCAPFPT